MLLELCFRRGGYHALVDYSTVFKLVRRKIVRVVSPSVSFAVVTHEVFASENLTSGADKRANRPGSAPPSLGLAWTIFLSRVDMCWHPLNYSTSIGYI